MHDGIANCLIWRWCQGKHSRHYLRIRNPQFYASGKRPIDRVFFGCLPMWPSLLLDAVRGLILPHCFVNTIVCQGPANLKGQFISQLRRLSPVQTCCFQSKIHSNSLLWLPWFLESCTQITGNSTICSNVCLGYHQRKHQRRVAAPLWGESTSNWWFSLTKGQSHEKCFHVMMSLSTVGI